MKTVCKVLGCRAGSPINGVPASGYLIKFPDGNILMDCGPGVMLSLTEEEVDKLMGVIITHQHADHVLDLMSMAYYLGFPNKRKPIPIYAPDSVFSMLNKFDEVFGIATLEMLKTPIGSAFSYKPVVPGEPFHIEKHRFQTLLMKHPVETMAVKSEELGLVYTADGAYTEMLSYFIRGSSTLIAEATYPEKKHHDLEAHGHMTAEQCALLAENANIQQLIVTHLSDAQSGSITMSIVKSFFDGIIILAYPGLEIYFNRS